MRFKIKFRIKPFGGFIHLTREHLIPHRPRQNPFPESSSLVGVFNA